VRFLPAKYQPRPQTGVAPTGPDLRQPHRFAGDGPRWERRPISRSTPPTCARRN